jgi:hypothetical protein
MSAVLPKVNTLSICEICKKSLERFSLSIGVRITVILCVVYLLRIFKIFHGFMNNPVYIFVRLAVWNRRFLEFWLLFGWNNVVSLYTSAVETSQALPTRQHTALMSYWGRHVIPCSHIHIYIYIYCAPLYRHWGSVQAVEGVALPLLHHGTRSLWGVSVKPRSLFTPGKDPVPLVQEAGWDPGPVWTGVENLAPIGIRSWTLQPVASVYIYICVYIYIYM